MVGVQETKKKQQHALAIPIPGVGHINPLMRFCKRLATEEGFTITFANIEPIHRRIEETAANEKEAQKSTSRQEEEEEEEEEAAAEVEVELDIRRVGLPFEFDVAELLSRSNKFEAFFGAMCSLAPHIEELLAKLVNAEPPVTCVISDMLLTAPTQLAAHKLGIPRIAFQASSLSTLLFTHYILQGALPLNTVLDVLSNKEQTRDDIFATKFLGLPTLKNGDLLDFIVDNPFVYKVHLEALQESKEKSCAIAINTFEELERDAFSVDFGMPIYAVGPLVDSLDKESSTSMWKEDQDSMKWLDKQPFRSVLYISFGSLATLTKSQYEEIVAGLLSSQQRFLWVVRSDLVKEASYMDISIEITLKSNGKGHTVIWAPQTRVLAHPATGGFLTHCGWNSTIEAISHGVPMLCFPYNSDQCLNATLIKEVWQVGLGFEVCNEIGITKRSEVERVVKLLMEEEGSNYLRVNAAHYQKHSLKSLQNGGISLKSIKHLVSLV